MIPFFAQVADSGVAPPAEVPVSPVEVTGDEVTDAVKKNVESWLGGFDRVKVEAWVDENLGSEHFWADIAVLTSCLLIGALAGWLFRRLSAKHPIKGIEVLRSRFTNDEKIPFYRVAVVPILWIALLVTNHMEVICPLTRATTLILSAYLLLKLPSLLVRRSFWIKPVTSILFAIVVLFVLGLLDESVQLLDSWSFTVGSFTISLLAIIWASLLFMLLLSVSRFLSSLVERQLSNASDMPPSVRVLARKLTQFGFVTAAVIISLRVLGINLTSFAVFGGALGLGIGFGLQKVISNLISGIILLLDKSIKPGDVIEIGGTYGWINSLRTRYVSVITRDNKEHLIPNEDLITHPVINWSFTDRLVRLRAPVGVSYDSDVHLARKLCVEAAKSANRVVSRPSPVCFLTGFGDSSVDLEIRFWIEDPNNGVTNVTSEVLLAVWDSFKEHKIEIPFPQRDLHIRSGLPSREVLSDMVDSQNPDP